MVPSVSTSDSSVSVNPQLQWIETDILRVIRACERGIAAINKPLRSSQVMKSLSSSSVNPIPPPPTSASAADATTSTATTTTTSTTTTVTTTTTATIADNSADSAMDGEERLDEIDEEDMIQRLSLYVEWMKYQLHEIKSLESSTLTIVSPSSRIGEISRKITVIEGIISRDRRYDTTPKVLSQYLLKQKQSLVSTSSIASLFHNNAPASNEATKLMTSPTPMSPLSTTTTESYPALPQQPTSSVKHRLNINDLTEDETRDDPFLIPSQDKLEAHLKTQRRLQEEMSDELLLLTQQFKEQQQRILTTLQTDSSQLDSTTHLLSTNVDKITVQVSGVKKEMVTSTKTNAAVWTMIIMVIISWICVYLFIKLIPKPR